MAPVVAVVAKVATAIFAKVTFAAVAKFVITTALSIGVSKLLAKRAMSGASAGGNGGGRVQLPPATDNKIPVVYGSAFIGGSIIDAYLTPDQKTMYYVVAFAEVTDTSPGSEISYGDIYYDGKLATFTSDGVGGTTKVSILTNNSTNPVQQDTRINNFLNIYLYKNGSDGATSGTNTTQNAYDVMPNWGNSTYAMTNCAFAIVKVGYSTDAGTTSLGAVTAQIKNTESGQATGEFRPGSAIKDYMLNTRYGCAIPLNAIDTVSLDNLNTYSSQTITVTGGPNPTQPRYRVNGPLDTASNCLNNLQFLVDTCDSWLQYSELTGKWKVVINKAYTQSPDAQTTNDLFVVNSSNLVGGIEISPIDLNETYNEIEVAYPNFNIKDQTDYQIIDLFDTNPSLLSQNEAVNRLNVTLPLVNNAVQAKYLAARRIYQSREDLVISFRTDYSGIQVEAGDVIRVYHETYGWDADNGYPDGKLFRVSEVIEEKDAEGNLFATFRCFEYNATVYVDNPVEDYIPAFNTGLKDPNIISNPGTPTVALNPDESGTVTSFTVTSSVPDDGLVLYMDFNYGNSSNVLQHRLYRTVQQSNGAPFTNSDSGNAVYNYANVSINDLPAGTYYWSLTARNNGSGARSSASAPFVWPGAGINQANIIDANGVFSSGNILTSNNAIPNLAINANVYLVSGTGQLANNTYITSINSTTPTANFVVSPTPVVALVNAEIQVIRGGINGNAIVPNTMPGNRVQPNTLPGNTLIGNTVNGNVLIGNTVNGNVIIGNTVNGNVLIGNTVNGNVIISNTVNGNVLIANSVNGNTIIANTINGNTVIANTLNGNTIIANTLNGNTIKANTLNGNTITANTLNGNTIIANTIDGNTIIANTIDGNTIIANTIDGNRIIANTLNGNTITANTLNGNRIVANTLNGNTVIANTLNGNTITANTLNGNTIIANTLDGNTIIAGTVTGIVIAANTLNGNTIIANTLNGNTVIANTLNGNTVIANTLNGNAITANTINGNSIIANTIDGNTIIANTINGNSIIANTMNGNRIVANTLNGNTIIANTLNGNSIQANTMNGNVIVANTLNGNTIIANTVNGNSLIANTVNGNIIIANTINGNAIAANTLNGNTVIANTLNGNSIQAFSINGGVAFIAGTIQAQAIAANTITFENLAIGAVTQSKSTISDPIVQPVPFTNVPNVWPNNTRCIIPAGGVTIVPSTDPGSSANTEYTEGSRIQISWAVKMYVDPGSGNVGNQWSDYNLIEIWKSGASSVFDRGINTLRQIYDVSGNANSASNQQLVAYGYAPSGLDLTSIDGGNSWTTVEANSTSKTITGAFTFSSSNVNALPRTGFGTSIVGPYTTRSFSDSGLTYVGTGTRDANNYGTGNALYFTSKPTGLSGNGVAYRTSTGGNITSGYQSSFLSLEFSPATGGNGYPYRRADQTGVANTSGGYILTGTNGDIFYGNSLIGGPAGSGTSAIGYDARLNRENIPNLFKDIYASYSNPTEANGTTYTAVVVGQSGTIARSERTISASDYANSWTAKSTYIQGDNTKPVLSDFYAVAGDNTDNNPATSKWVAVGQYGMIQVSTDDGDTWNQVFLGNSVTCDFNGVRYGNGKWVAVGDGGNIYVSSNAANANSWTQISTSNLNYTNGTNYGSIYGNSNNSRQLNTVNYNGEWNTWSIGGQGIILYSNNNANTFTVAYEQAPSETYDLTRLTFFGSWPNVANVSRPPVEQRVLNNQVFSGTILDTGYVAGQETTYYLVIGNMNGNTILAGQIFLQVQEIKR